MQKTIAAMFCVVCLVAAGDVRAQTGADQARPPVGYGPAPGGYRGAPDTYGAQATYGGPGANFVVQQPAVGYGAAPGASGGQAGYGGASANLGVQQPRRESGIMGIVPNPVPTPAGPHSTPNPDAIGVPTTPGVPVTMCMNRNPPEGTVITKSIRRPRCGDKCESEIQLPAGNRMLICRGQAIPEGYRLELLTTTPDCSCYGRDQNAYMIKAETANDEFKQAFPQ